MRIFIKILAFIISPFIKAAEEAKHGVAKEGALFYIRDIKEMDQHLKDFAVTCANESRNELSLESKKYIETLWQTEKQELREWLDETIDKRIENQDEALEQLITDFRNQFESKKGNKS